MPAAAVGQEEIEEVGAAPNEGEMPACKHEDKEEVAPEVGAAVPHVRKIHFQMTDYSRASREPGVGSGGSNMERGMVGSCGGG